MWYTQWKENRLVDSGRIEWEELKEAFLGKYFPRVEEYSLKFTMVSRYAPSMVSNPRDEMIRFMTGVADLVKEEWRTTMLPVDMNLSRLMVYSQSIEESKISRISSNLNRCGSSE